jgi:DNA-directed RNA polymerase subunit RPC12/RpoP
MTTQTRRFILHACPRCLGDLIPDEESHFACLQCGHRVLVRESLEQASLDARDEARSEVTHAAA